MTGCEHERGTIQALCNEQLEAAASRLVDVFRHEQHNPEGAEAKALERLLDKLKQARTIAAKLSPANRMRVFNNPAQPTSLLDLIEATETAMAAPLPGKAKQENLYHAMAFHYQMITKRRPTLGRSSTPNLFQKFMAIIVCRIDGRPGDDWGDYVERTTQHYKRVVQNGKK